MDVFVEEIVRKRKTGTDIIKVLGLVLAATLIAAVVFMFVVPIAPQFGSGLFLLVVLAYYGAYWLATSLNLEYEYSLVGHEIDVDKIINRKKRKKLTTVDIKRVEAFGYKGSDNHEYQKFLADIAINDFNYSIETYKTEDIIVFNRYHIGEYVYGQIYRNENPNQILEVIKMIEDRILENIPQDNIYYIQLLSTSSELLQRNDDGKSFSDAKLELIEREQQLFKEAFEKSKFRNKHIIYVNKENTNEFKDRQTIINEFNEFTKSDLKKDVKD